MAKRYLVELDNGSARVRPTQRHAIVFRADDYKSAWKNCRNALRAGGVFQTETGDDVRLAGGAFRVRSVFSMDDATGVTPDALIGAAVAASIIDESTADMLRELATELSAKSAAAAA